MREPLITSRCCRFLGPNDGIRPGGGLLQASCLKQEGRTVRPALQGIALLTNAELVDDRAVALDVHLLEVVEEAAATSDEFQEAAAGVVVLRVRLEVLGK